MKKTYLTLTALIAVTSLASAQTILEYNGGPENAFATFDATFTDSNLIASSTAFTSAGTASLVLNTNAGQVGFGPGVDAAGTPYELGTMTPSDTPYFQSNGYSETFDATNANGFYGASVANYVGFSFTAADSFSLGTIAFDLARGGSSGERGATVVYDLNSSGTFSPIGVAAMDTGNGEYGRYTFDFGSIALEASDEVEIRFLGFSNATGNSFRFDNLAIAAIPEPGSFALLAGLIGSLAVFARRRRS
jgi:hypothetical protein